MNLMAHQGKGIQGTGNQKIDRTTGKLMRLINEEIAQYQSLPGKLNQCYRDIENVKLNAESRLTKLQDINSRLQTSNAQLREDVAALQHELSLYQQEQRNFSGSKDFRFLDDNGCISPVFSGTKDGEENAKEESLAKAMRKCQSKGYTCSRESVQYSREVVQMPYITGGHTNHGTCRLTATVDVVAK